MNDKNKLLRKELKTLFNKTQTELLANIDTETIEEIKEHCKEYKQENPKQTATENKIQFWWNVADVKSETKNGLNPFDLFQIIKIYLTNLYSKNGARRTGARLNALFYERVKQGDAIGLLF